MEWSGRSTAFLVIALAVGAIAATVFGTVAGLAQSDDRTGPAAVAREETAGPPTHSLGSQAGNQQTEATYASGTRALIETPVSGLFPGGVSTRLKLNNPVANDPAAAQRGMAYFTAFNCIGCHAPNGGGGMGRALSNRFFQYGGDPANIYLTIVQGRPNGMPAWGGVLPDTVIWDLVAYIEQIGKAPAPEWGTTISLQSPSIEQVPAEYLKTTNPWAYTEPFSHGQKPEGRNEKK
jgi:cytochrome c oxidase cbb3-type subunit 3